MNGAVVGGGEPASCSSDRLSRSLAKDSEAPRTLQRAAGSTLIMLSNIALIPGSIDSSAVESSVSIPDIGDGRRTHVKCFPKHIPQLIYIRRKRIVVCGTHNFRGGEPPEVLVERLRGHGDLFGSCPGWKLNGELEVDQVKLPRKKRTVRSDAFGCEWLATPDRIYDNIGLCDVLVHESKKSNGATCDMLDDTVS
jgi:hypothetical protein